MLTWTVWNRIVFDIEIVYVRYTELFEIELFLIFSWVWNRTVNMYKMDLQLITPNGLCAIKQNPSNQQTLSSYDLFLLFVSYYKFSHWYNRSLL